MFVYIYNSTFDLSASPPPPLFLVQKKKPQPELDSINIVQKYLKKYNLNLCPRLNKISNHCGV